MDNMDIYDMWDDTWNRVDLVLDTETLRLYWKPKSGDKIYIEDMETSHIENIIRADLGGRFTCGTATKARFLLELSIRRRLENMPGRELGF